VRAQVLERFTQVVTGVAEAMGCQAEVMVQPLTLAVINDAGVTQRVQAVAARLLPDSQVDTTERTMVSEDMSEMMQDIPGCYFLIGSANPGKGLDYAHHHPHFDFDEDALPRAAALMASAAAEFLGGL
jgi:metal-dependent amidase/aminoacylase/carboxypeptidase family protein